MRVRSLVDLATAACIKNIRGLEGVGDYLPYENVRHILLRVENAHQLRRIELNSPQIEGKTGEIWLKLIEKDFPIEYRARGYKPQDPKKWFKVWEKYKREHDDSVKESAMKLKDAFAGLRQDREKNTSKIVERRLLPRSGATGPPRRYGPREGTSNSLMFGSGSRTKTLSGAGVMRKVRREVKEIANIHGSLSKSVRGPVRHSGVNKAPVSMVNAYKRAARPAQAPSRPPPQEPPRVPSAVTEHEARATFISDSEDDDNGGDYLFDESERPPPRKPIMRQPTDGPSPSKPKSLAGMSRMAQKFGGGFSSTSSVKKVSTANPSSASSISHTSPQKSESRFSGVSSGPGPRQSSPNNEPSNAGAPSSSTNLPPLVRKRKTTDIFMRPRKRPN
ncbi:unnamed protein product [Clonostachys rosea f. rosea IK726]|uniref:Elongin-A n=2 Tax=Bionectria ochroleuca TaxID=29856 RepID=A0A0B7JV36_BIOOC|nr:unnamed protein product [Clonostachys rosea f. rosea IK726]